jgi:pyruvate/2-oxoglutarate dehydrogenase complex dihydrolipoamide dehydrogenase (E3) component
MTRDFDAIVIGTGQAGPPLARRMAGEGLRVAVIERHLPGGTCVNTGCIPTKTLVATAKVAAMARRAGEYGVVLPGPVTVDMPRVKARMRALVERSRNGVRKSLERESNVTFVHGHARFTGPDTVAVAGEQLRAARIFVDVGARAAKPDLPGADEVPAFDNASLLASEELPAHLIVVGGGYVGLEFAQMYRRFGSEVTLVHRGRRLVAHEDEDVSAALHALLEAEGIHVRLGATCAALARRGDEVVAEVDCSEGPPEVVGSHLLFAIGRTPNTDDLGLDRAGVRTDERGHIVVDDRLQTSVPGIWALGDCNGRGGFTHTAYDDHEIVAANLLDGGDRKVSDRIRAYALYTDPPLGRCGMTEAEARASGREVLVGRYDMAHIGRAQEKGETTGFLKILVDADSEQILGASFLGVEGDEVVHTVLELMYAQAPWTVITRSVPIHPTVSEYLPSLLHALEPLR